MKSLQCTAGRPAARLLILAVMLGSGSWQHAAAAVTANWAGPSFDTWFYRHAVFPGANEYGASWGKLEVADGATEFTPSTDAQAGATRHSMMLLAFDTSDQVTKGLSPDRYQVDHVTVTLKLKEIGPDGTGTITPICTLPTAESTPL